VPVDASPAAIYISGLLDELNLCHRKIRRFTEGLSQKELDWTPIGVNNSMSWLLTHLTVTLWTCHAAATGTTTKYNPLAAGIAMGSTRGIDYGTTVLGPSSAPHPTRDLDIAHAAFTELLLKGPDLNRATIYADRKWRTALWFVTHEIGDFAYHTGQSSYLRKMIAAERKRYRPLSHSRSPRLAANDPANRKAAT